MDATILPVEDEPAIQELLAINVTQSGYCVVRARNVADALAHIRRLRQALESSGLNGLVQSVRGSGYRFSCDETFSFLSFSINAFRVVAVTILSFFHHQFLTFDV